MKPVDRQTGRKPVRVSYREFREAAVAAPCCASAGRSADGCTIGRTAEKLVLLARDGVATAAPASAFEDLLGRVEGLPVHGFWHHTLPGELLLLCLQRAGYPIDDELIDEVVERGPLTPPGACGCLGPCGALVSAASAYATLLGSTPAAADRRERLLVFHARLTSRLADLGGSRCCKKSAYTALELAREEFAKIGFELPQEQFAGRCRFFADNDTCDGADCVYFPQG